MNNNNEVHSYLMRWIGKQVVDRIHKTMDGIDHHEETYAQPFVYNAYDKLGISYNLGVDEGEGGKYDDMVGVVAIAVDSMIRDAINDICSVDYWGSMSPYIYLRDEKDIFPIVKYVMGDDKIMGSLMRAIDRGYVFHYSGEGYVDKDKQPRGE